MAHGAGSFEDFLQSFGNRGRVALEALIFDFDGTLAETERDGHRVAYNEAFGDLELPWFWTDTHYAELLGVAGGKERVAHFIAHDDPPRPPGDPAELAAAIHQRKVAHFADLAYRLALRPGVVRLVAEAKAAGLKLAVATTASESGVRAVLAQSPQTLEAFDVIAAGDVVPSKKPAPDVYIYALAQLGVESAAAIAFEDSSIGLTAALAAGLTTVVTPSSYTMNQRFTGAAVVKRDLDDGIDLAFLTSLK